MRQFFRVTIVFTLIVVASFSSRKTMAGDAANWDLFSKTIQMEFDKHNHKKLIKTYQDFQEKNSQQFIPFRIRALYCQSLAEVGDVEGSIKSLRELASDWPIRLDIIKIQYDLANLLFMQGMKEEARDVYQKIILQSEQSSQFVQKSRERLSQLKQLETKKKDQTALQILEIESSVEVGDVSLENIDVLKKIIAEEPRTRNATKAQDVLQRANELRNLKYHSLLEEARRLFDEEKKYNEVNDILQIIDRDYKDIAEAPSVEALKKSIKEKSKN